MGDVKKQDGSIVSCFTFPETFIGFTGHFPKHKILPGVCQIQCALAVLERAFHKTAELREVSLAKYFAPVLPGEEIMCACSDVFSSGEFTFKAVITKGPVRVSEMKLRVTLSDTEKNR